MALVYQPPGTSVNEIVSPTISSLLANPTSVCLIGLSAGTITRTDQVVLSGTTPTALPGLPVASSLSSVTSVVDALDPSKGQSNGSGYIVTTDYTVQTSNGTVTRVSSGGIADNTLVRVTYTYVPSDYFDPIRLDSLNAVEQRFGSSYNAAGTAINSAVSYAAGIAFENGAGSVVIQPLFIRATPGDPATAKNQPTSTQVASTSSWTDTLFALRDYEDINVIIPVIGQSAPNMGDASQLAILSAIQDHIQFMRGEDQYIVALTAEDSSASSAVATRPTLVTHAATLKSRYGGALAEQTVVLSSTKALRALPGVASVLSVGGQYVAAAIGGMLAARPVQSALTRAIVSSFNGLGESPKPTKADKNAMAQAGLMVIEERNGTVLVRHGITLADSSSATQELSVVRGKHYMIESVRDTIERQIIGQTPADGNAPGLVQTTIIGVLEALRRNRAIVAYSGVQTQISAANPTIVLARFSYAPVFPLNFVQISFSLDLSNSTITATSETLPSV